MIVDCDRCAVRDHACRDCVMSVLLDPPSGASPVTLDAPEREALAVLAAQGLVPRLRLVTPPTRRAPGSGDGRRRDLDAG